MDHRKELREAAEELERATRRRHEAILRASEAGLSRAQVAEALGLTRGRVQQIITKARREPDV
ncbi:MAG: helix-turn-helix domain-containing protein [Actinomycetota bacterium]|nr:helix-turn-helix domain-containing protein [Actinomycetota bacterium]